MLAEIRLYSQTCVFLALLKLCLTWVCMHHRWERPTGNWTQNLDIVRVLLIQQHWTTSEWMTVYVCCKRGHSGLTYTVGSSWCGTEGGVFVSHVLPPSLVFTPYPHTRTHQHCLTSPFPLTPPSPANRIKGRKVLARQTSGRICMRETDSNRGGLSVCVWDWGLVGLCPLSCM